MNYQSLVNAVKKGQQYDYLFFWGDTTPQNGTINKTCLSQWYAQGFDYKGEYFATAEHWMMAAKARLFGDEINRKAILAIDSPREAKLLGRQVKGFVATQWEKAAFDIVYKGNLIKFSQNEAVSQFLRSTGNTIIVEASPHDRIWGIGMDEHNPKAINPLQWDGTNLLGLALMKVRSQLNS
jgi:ribA/ribD-fused uncharacterized protein